MPIKSLSTKNKFIVIQELKSSIYSYVDRINEWSEEPFELTKDLFRMLKYLGTENTIIVELFYL